MKNLVISSIVLLSSLCSLAQEGNVKVSQSYVLDSLIVYRKELNFQQKLQSQYKVQIYSGQKAEADLVESEFKEGYPSWYSEMVFETPNYKVRVGAFYSRLEADKELVELKKKYPNAFVYNK